MPAKSAVKKRSKKKPDTFERYEGIAAFVLLVTLILFWGDLLINALAGLLSGSWCLRRIYLRKEKRVLLFFCASLLLFQGASDFYSYVQTKLQALAAM